MAGRVIFDPNGLPRDARPEKRVTLARLGAHSLNVGDRMREVLGGSKRSTKTGKETEVQNPSKKQEI